MSEQAPERGSRENVFTRRIGPLPMWQWLLIAAAMLGVYVLFQYRKKNQQAASAANSTAGTSTGGTTGAGQVPQFVNQTYTYVAPPAAGSPPPSAHAAAPVRRPPPRPGTPTPSAAPATGGGLQLVGLTLAQAIQQIRNAGATVNSVSNAQGQGVNQSAYQNAPVTAQGYFATGQAGQNFANSYNLQV